MPVEFKQTAMPQGSTDNELYKLEMKYDGSGRRISKTVWRKAVGTENWQKKQVTHYTGIGTEISENYHNESLDKAKVVVNMPEGLGRYGIEHADAPAAATTYAWFLHDHLGSTGRRVRLFGKRRRAIGPRACLRIQELRRNGRADLIRRQGHGELHRKREGRRNRAGLLRRTLS